MQLVVPIAVRNAVSAATRTFTANSMIFCFFIRFSFLFGGAGCPFVFSVVRGCPFVFSVVQGCGGQPLSRLEARDYSGGGLSALRVTSSPPKLGGVRGGLNARSVCA